MAKINAGILGGFVNKVGNVVGAKWKGKDYMRLRVIPANPRTEAQVAQREKMAQIMGFARFNKVAVIDKSYAKEVKSLQMSPINRFVQKSMKIGPLAENFELMPWADGPVSPVKLTAAAYDTATNELTFTMEENVIGYASASDKVQMFVSYIGEDFVDMIQDYDDADSDRGGTVAKGTGMYRILSSKKQIAFPGTVFLNAICKNEAGEVSKVAFTTLVIS